VLSRPSVHAKFTVLTREFVEDFMRTLLGMTTVSDDVPRTIAFSRDHKDEPYLNLALRAQAHYLVSRDNDILDLNAPEDPVGEELRKGCPQLQILGPSAFLAQLKARVSLID
jgi:predicted nucleic acid-binding protein